MNAEQMEYVLVLLAGLVDPMKIIGLLFAVLFGALFGFTLWRSWRAEHGKKLVIPADSDRSVNNINAIWLIAYFPVVFLSAVTAFKGDPGGATMAVETESSVSYAVVFTLAFLMKLLIFASVYYAVLLLALPYGRKKLNARTCAVFWSIPFMATWFSELVAVNADDNLFSILELRIPLGVPLKILSGIWLGVFAVILIWQILSNSCFRRTLERHSEWVEDEEILAIWREEKERVGFDFAVALKTCNRIHTPLSMGLSVWNKVTFLPNRKFSERDLRLIFRHELHHIQRNDMSTKCSLMVFRAFLWFNPLMWLAVKHAEEDLELSCDEIVVEELPREEKTHYAHLLLSTVGEARGFSTCLSATAESLRYRLRATLEKKKKWHGVPLVIAVCIVSYLALMCFQVVFY